MINNPIHNPIPSATRVHNDGGYDSDSGLDILVPVGTQVLCAADGEIIYAEHGHTPWGTSCNVGIDTPNSVLVKLKAPLTLDGVEYHYTWYTHLSSLDQHLPDGSTPKPIKVGDKIGKSGIGNQVPHLHFGIVQDRAQTVTMPQHRVADLIWSK